MLGVTRQFTVWCDDCGNWHQISDSKLSVCAKIWKRMGWTFVLHVGWLCAECTSKVKGMEQ